MNLEDAIKRAREWEDEDEAKRPTRGSEDEPNMAGSFTRVGDHIVYSYLTQGHILTEVWDLWDLIIAVERTLREAATSGENPYQLWPYNKPTGPDGVA